MANVKTNAVRILERADIRFNMLSYDWDGKNAPDGNSVAAMLGQDPGQVFKTLVARGASGDYYVFDIPVSGSLDLKKAAKAVGEKSIAMIKSKELLPLTGYIHGGCSPIGMKKQFRTVIDSSAEKFETILFSAGKIGYQVEVALLDLQKVVRVESAQIVVNE